MEALPRICLVPDCPVNPVGQLLLARRNPFRTCWTTHSRRSRHASILLQTGNGSESRWSAPFYMIATWARSDHK